MGNKFLIKSFVETGDNGDTKLKYREFIDWIAENNLKAIEILQEHRGLWGTTLEDLSNQLNETDTNFINLVFSSLLNLKDLKSIYKQANKNIVDISSKAFKDITEDQEDYFYSILFESGSTKASRTREAIRSNIKIMVDIEAVFKAIESLLSIENNKFIEIIGELDLEKEAEDLVCNTAIREHGQEEITFEDVKPLPIKKYTEDTDVNTYISHLNRLRSDIIQRFFILNY